MSYGISPVAGHAALIDVPPAAAAIPGVSQPGAPAGAKPVESLELDSRAPSHGTGAGRTFALENHELHFSRNEETGHIVVQVRTREGVLVRVIPNEEALEVLAGRAL